MAIVMGEGSHGIVYLNSDEDDEVIKKVCVEDYDEQMQTWVLNSNAVAEIIALTRLRDCKVPYIVELKGVDSIDDEHLIQLHLERCKPLSAKALDEYGKRRIIAQLFMALQGMHDCDVYHGDIKPENLLRSPEGDLRIIDFGLADVSHNTPLAKGTELMYTITYRPPELLLETDYFDRGKADVWAAGITALEILLGHYFIQYNEEEFDWMDALSQIEAAFGTLSKYGKFCKRWEKYKHSQKRHDIKPVILPIKDPMAYNFIMRACSLTPSERWTAKELLKHPYIQDLCDVTVPLYKRITIQAIPRAHPIFMKQRNPEREIITKELLNVIGDDLEELYIGATNVVSCLISEKIILKRFDRRQCAKILSNQVALRMLSKHLFVRNLLQDDFTYL
jgi:serine/threonine protein kinase